MKDSQSNGLYPIISIVIVLQVLGLFAYLYQNKNVEQSLPVPNSIQVYNQVQPDIETAAIVHKSIVVSEEPSIIDQLLAEYTTNFNAYQTARVANIELAAQLINNKVLKPRQIFSYNETVGERTIKAGFKIAPVIVNKKVSSGVGGGICQVSSTLYNTVLDSKLEIIERHPHSIQVNYVPRGRDATVAYDYLDFQFKNNQNSYIIIKTEITKGKLTIKIFSLQ